MVFLFQMLWESLLLLNLLVIIIGVIGHVLFILFSIVPNYLNSYCRILLLLTTSGRCVLIVSYFAEMMVCLLNGTYLEDSVCAQSVAKDILLRIHRYCEMMDIAMQFLYSADRYINTNHLKFYNTKIYATLFYVSIGFIAFISIVYSIIFEVSTDYIDDLTMLSIRKFFITLMFALSFTTLIMEIIDYKFASKQYRNTIGTETIERRYELSTSLDYTKCFALASIVSTMIEAITAILFLLLLEKKIKLTIELPKLYSILNLFLNFDASSYSWIVLLNHRLLKMKLKNIFKSCMNYLKYGRNRRHYRRDSMKTFDGKKLIHTPTQSDYFNQLKIAWA